MQILRWQVNEFDIQSLFPFFLLRRDSVWAILGLSSIDGVFRVMARDLILIYYEVSISIGLVLHYRKSCWIYFFFYPSYFDVYTRCQVHTLGKNVLTKLEGIACYLPVKLIRSSVLDLKLLWLSRSLLINVWSSI